MKNVIQLRNGFVNLANANENNYQTAMAVVSELMQFGFILDKTAIDNLTSASRTDIVAFHNEVITYLKDITGSKTTYKPFWKGFPQEVMEKTECELWLHQIVHYMSNGAYEPNEWTQTRPTAFEQSKYTTIVAGNEDRFLQIFTDLVSVNQSLTPDDLEIVKWFVSSNTELRFPSVIPFKENLCTLASMGLDVPVKTVTDVLRIAVGMSGGDISLPKVPYEYVKLNAWSSTKSKNPERELFKFKKFSRQERRFIMGLLEKTNCDASEAILKAQRWVRLGEILHAGEFTKTHPKAAGMFNIIRNTKISSWYGKVNDAFANSFEDGVKKLSERPGEFVRRLDWLLRSNGAERKELVFKYLNEVLPKVSNKVLFETFSHFEKRDSPKLNRTVMVKGARRATRLPDLPAINGDTIGTIQDVIMSGLKVKFSELPEMGEVWIDEALKNIPLPTNMRSMNSALKPTVRGTRIPIGNQNAKVIRAFVHWLDERGNIDIDLTATFLGMGKVKHIGWNGSRNDVEGCYSGDIRHRQGPCAEYIDINIAATLKSGYKYVILDTRNYNGCSMASITDCVFGWMEREFPQAGEIFVPNTLANTVRMQSESSTTLVAMIDVETQEYVFLDIDQQGIPVASANFETIFEAIKPYMEAPKVSVYDLLKLHVEARGIIVADKDKAKTHLTFDQFSESYVETLKFMGV